MSQVAARIEGTSEYRRSLDQVLALGREFQGTLDSSQRQSWLAFEDALLEHASQLNQAYFQAGLELGKRRTEGVGERELIIELARLIGKLAAR